MDQCIRLVPKTNNFFIFQNRLNKEKSGIEVLDTSGILPSKKYTHLSTQLFRKLFYKFSKFHGVPSRSLFVPNSVSQNNSFSRQIEDLMTVETTEQVVIPDPEVPERAHSSKFSGKENLLHEF
jgi:hypothetical protein